MAIPSKYKLEQYQYGVQVRKGRQLYMMSEKKIYFGEWLTGNRDPIIIIEMSKQIADREALFYLEVNDHKNIIHTFASVGNPSNLTIFVQEYAPQGDLADCLMDNQFQFTQPMLVQIFAQIADAMSHVAKKNIVHGDLGCRNVLVFRVDSSEPKNNLVKITDFGLARWIQDPPTDEDTTIVPIRYCALEILRDNRHSSYSEKSDVYSMGVLIWEALSNSEIPYSSVAKDEDVTQRKLNNERLPKPQVCDQQLWILMNSCWHKSPEKRPTFDEIKDKLMHITITEVSHDLITATSHKGRIKCDYELDIHVKIERLLYDGRPSIYEAQWITEEDERPIILIEKNEEPSEHEQLFYTTFKDHPHIVHTFGFVENDRGSIMILQERTSYGNLQSLLETGQFQPSASVLVEIFSQIINAMIDIVDQGLVHGDLRCENILVFQMHPSDPKRNLVKLSNFTLVHPNDPSHTDERRLFVPVRYCALEILRSAGRSNYSELSDVYSMGVLMWQACSKGKRPYDSSVTNGEVRQRKLKGEKLSRPLLCDDQIWSIMTDCCWHNSPEVRFTFKEMKIQFSKINFKSIEPYQYELDKNVKQKRPLNGMNGRFYEADWIPKKDQPILLFVIDGPAAEREALLNMKLKSCSHIIRTFGLVKNDRQSVMLLQERAPHGDLQTLLQSGNFKPSPKVLVAIFLQIVDAMIYVSHQGIVHGDLRCANILVFEMDSSEPKKNLVKLTNFSLARTKDQSVTNNRLPDSHVRYCAPEILRSEDGSNYCELSDVYSMGVLMWEACSKGEVPFGHRTSDHDVQQKILNNQNLLKPKDCPNPLWNLIESCWLRELSIRSTFEDLKSMLSRIDVTPIRLVTCHSCNKDIPESDIEDHQQLCVPSKPPIRKTDRINNDVIRPDHGIKRPVDSDEENDERLHSIKHVHTEPPRTTAFSTRLGHSNDSFVDDVIVGNQQRTPIRRYSDVSPEKSVRDRSCKHCGESYPDGLIQEHETSYCPKRFPSRGIEPKPQPSYVKCVNCNKQFTNNEIANHKKTCPWGTTISLIDSENLRSIPCTKCNKQFSLEMINTHEETCRPQRRSLFARICSCMCFQKSDD